MAGLLELIAEAERQLTICNACRYCEGYCAVFPAAERRSAFALGDVVQLANLCHDCRACHQACMFAPPHEFGVDIPGLMRQVRLAGYRRYAWPGALAALFGRPRLTAALVGLAGMLLALLAVVWSHGPGALARSHTGPGAFYQLIGYELLLAGFLALTALVVLVLGVGGRRLWRDVGGDRASLDPGAWAATLADVLLLRYLGGGGGGCYHPDPLHPSRARRVLHQLLFGGFALAFAATLAAAVEQDLLGWLPPYPLLSVPVLLGTAGGAAMVIGAGGLLWLGRRASTTDAPRSRTLDGAFLWLSEAVGVSGLALLALRTTPLIGPLLILHLGTVVGVFVTAPYGKLVHGLHRTLALLQDRAEARREP
ncbi:MAG TPA: tricarballylate utilization 4Fe-4S protein TcuB [Candidatus Dormibacteraeota bacterium]|nr:tricarballylate utilization 4Fe-4S protein TcuB [Candidatus Dormibacteraeota bacterium]